MAGNKSGGRKTGSLYLTVIVAMMLLAGIIGLGIFFKISDIYVEGASIYSAEEVIAVSGIEYDESIFFLNGSAAAVRIKNALAYVDEVRITHSLPGTVTIEVTESYPIGYIRHEGRVYIIDKNAKVLDVAESPEGGMIELRGLSPIAPTIGETLSLGEDGDVKLLYLKNTLGAIMKAGIYNDIQWLSVENISAITFRYENRFTVIIGKGEDVSDKLWLLGKIEENHPGSEKATVDVSEVTEGHYIPE